MKFWDEFCRTVEILQKTFLKEILGQPQLSDKLQEKKQKQQIVDHGAATVLECAGMSYSRQDTLESGRCLRRSPTLQQRFELHQHCDLADGAWSVSGSMPKMPATTPCFSFFGRYLVREHVRNVCNSWMFLINSFYQQFLLQVSSGDVWSGGAGVTKRLVLKALRYQDTCLQEGSLPKAYAKI